MLFHLRFGLVSAPLFRRSPSASHISRGFGFWGSVWGVLVLCCWFCFFFLLVVGVLGFFFLVFFLGFLVFWVWFFFLASSFPLLGLCIFVCRHFMLIRPASPKGHTSLSFLLSFWAFLLAGEHPPTHPSRDFPFFLRLFFSLRGFLFAICSVTTLQLFFLLFTQPFMVSSLHVFFFFRILLLCLVVVLLLCISDFFQWGT